MEANQTSLLEKKNRFSGRLIESPTTSLIRVLKLGIVRIIGIILYHHFVYTRRFKSIYQLPFSSENIKEQT